MLTVEGEHDVRGSFFQFDGDGGGVGNNQRAVGQGKRADWCHDHRRHSGMDHWSTGCQRVGGRAGRRGNDKPVGPIGRQIAVIDIGLDVGQAGQGTFIDHHIVEDRFDRAFLVPANHPDQQPHAGLSGECALQYGGRHGKEAIFGNFGQEADFAELDPQNRDGLIADPAYGAQKGAVAAQNENAKEIGRGLLQHT